MKENVHLNYDIGGEVVKENETYIVKDNKFGHSLVLSSTSLHRDKSTNGHKHEGQEEIYYFVRGVGEMELNDYKFPVGAGCVVTVPDGVFHRVHNTGKSDLYFLCVFQGQRQH